MDPPLAELMASIEEYKAAVLEHRQTMSAKANDVLQKFQALQHFLQSLAKNRRQAWLRKFVSQMYKVHVISRGRLGIAWNTAIHSRIAGAYDRGMQVIGKPPNTFFNRVKTMLLDDFIRGITNFASHRPNSCGSSKESWALKFFRDPRDTPQQRFQKAVALRTCFIERLIYNELWLLLDGHQHQAHQDELRRMEALYRTYYPNQEVFVQLDMCKESAREYQPFKVSILYRDPTRIVHESFEHDGDLVKGYKVVHENGRTLHYEVRQTYDSGPQPWHSVATPGGGGKRRRTQGSGKKQTKQTTPKK